MPISVMSSPGSPDWATEEDAWRFEASPSGCTYTIALDTPAPITWIIRFDLAADGADNSPEQAVQDTAVMGAILRVLEILENIGHRIDPNLFPEEEDPLAAVAEAMNETIILQAEKEFEEHVAKIKAERERPKALHQWNFVTTEDAVVFVTEPTELIVKAPVIGLEVSFLAEDASEKIGHVVNTLLQVGLPEALLAIPDDEKAEMVERLRAWMARVQR